MTFAFTVVCVWLFSINCYRSFKESWDFIGFGKIGLHVSPTGSDWWRTVSLQFYPIKSPRYFSFYGKRRVYVHYRETLSSFKVSEKTILQKEISLISLIILHSAGLFALRIACGLRTWDFCRFAAPIIIQTLVSVAEVWKTCLFVGPVWRDMEWILRHVIWED